MNQRTERLAAEIQSVLAEIIARGEIRDPRVRDAGIVTITQVRVTGDLGEGRVSFTVFGADAATLERVRQGLTSARTFLQQALARRLRTRKTALLSFEVDRSVDNAFRIDGLLREAAVRDAQTSHPPPSGVAATPQEGDVSRAPARVEDPPGARSASTAGDPGDASDGDDNDGP